MEGVGEVLVMMQTNVQISAGALCWNAGVSTPKGAATPLVSYRVQPLVATTFTMRSAAQSELAPLVT